MAYERQILKVTLSALFYKFAAQQPLAIIRGKIGPRRHGVFDSVAINK
jgi:hypothetical protein